MSKSHADSSLLNPALRSIGGIDGQDAVLLAVLASAIGSGTHDLSVPQLARQAMTSTRTVRRRLRRLEDRGLLRIMRQPTPRPNRYELCGPLENLSVSKKFGPDE